MDRQNVRCNRHIYELSYIPRLHSLSFIFRENYSQFYGNIADLCLLKGGFIMLFFKKKNEVKIVVDNVTNMRVRKSVNNHKIKNSKVIIREYGGFSTIKFKTKETTKEVFESLKNEIGIFFDVELKNGLIHVTEKERTR